MKHAPPKGGCSLVRRSGHKPRLFERREKLRVFWFFQEIEIVGSRGPLPRAALAAPPPPSAPMPPPTWLPPQAEAVWQAVEPLLRQGGRLRPEHADALASWCCSAAELRHLSQRIAAEGPIDDSGRISAAARHAAKLRALLLQTGRPLGLDPAAACRFDAMPGPQAADDDPLAAFAAKRADYAGR